MPPDECRKAYSLILYLAERRVFPSNSLALPRHNIRHAPLNAFLKLILSKLSTQYLLIKVERTITPESIPLFDQEAMAFSADVPTSVTELTYSPDGKRVGTLTTYFWIDPVLLLHKASPKLPRRGPQKTVKMGEKDYVAQCVIFQSNRSLHFNRCPQSYTDHVRKLRDPRNTIPPVIPWSASAFDVHIIRGTPEDPHRRAFAKFEPRIKKILKKHRSRLADVEVKLCYINDKLRRRYDASGQLIPLQVEEFKTELAIVILLSQGQRRHAEPIDMLIRRCLSNHGFFNDLVQPPLRYLICDPSWPLRETETVSRD